MGDLEETPIGAGRGERFPGFCLRRTQIEQRCCGSIGRHGVSSVQGYSGIITRLPRAIQPVQEIRGGLRQKACACELRAPRAARMRALYAPLAPRVGYFVIPGGCLLPPDPARSEPFSPGPGTHAGRLQDWRAPPAVRLSTAAPLTTGRASPIKRKETSTMPYRVVTWGTGNVGTYAVRAVVNHPELELVGHIVSSAEKSGKDVAELAGLESATGILATDDID